MIEFDTPYLTPNGDVLKIYLEDYPLSPRDRSQGNALRRARLSSVTLSRTNDRTPLLVLSPVLRTRQSSRRANSPARPRNKDSPFCKGLCP